MAVFPSDSIRTKNWGTEILTDSDLETQLDLLHAYFVACLHASTGHNHDGTSNQGPKIPVTNLTVGSQAQGDIIYASSASAWVRLGAGTNGYFLKTQGAGANPTWADASVPSAAAQADQETATSTTTYVSPGRQQYHPSASKGWCYFNGTTVGTNAPTAGYNVTSVTRNGTGDYTINWTTAFSSANYCVLGNAGNGSDPSTNAGIIVPRSTWGTTSARVLCFDNGGAAIDPIYVNIVAFGDQ